MGFIEMSAFTTDVNEVFIAIIVVDNNALVPGTVKEFLPFLGYFFYVTLISYSKPLNALNFSV